MIGIDWGLVAFVAVFAFAKMGIGFYFGWKAWPKEYRSGNWLNNK